MLIHDVRFKIPESNKEIQIFIFLTKIVGLLQLCVAPSSVIRRLQYFKYGCIIIELLVLFTLVSTAVPYTQSIVSIS